MGLPGLCCFMVLVGLVVCDDLLELLLFCCILFCFSSCVLRSCCYAIEFGFGDLVLCVLIRFGVLFLLVDVGCALLWLWFEVCGLIDCYFAAGCGFDC